MSGSRFSNYAHRPVYSVDAQATPSVDS
jgi:hypothetical protein